MAILTALLILIAPVRIILKYEKSMDNKKVIRQGIGGSDIWSRTWVSGSSHELVEEPVTRTPPHAEPIVPY